MLTILPKSSEQTSTITKSNLHEIASPLSKYVDIGIQTELIPHRRRRNNVKTSDTSRQTQTGDKRQKISSETQTVGEFSLDLRNKNKCNKLNNRRKKKSMETQTCTNKSRGQESADNNLLINPILAGNNQLPSTDINLTNLWWDAENTSTETLQSNDTLKDDNKNLQTYFGSFSEDSNFELNLLKDVLLFSTQEENVSFDDGKSCSTETQTEQSSELLQSNSQETDISSDIKSHTSLDLIDQYSNTYTQTCDDILFPYFGFSDIETQTAYSEFDISFADIETQTMPNHLANNL
uniref:Uncharacterized protein n=2 Tax=Clastoptera arizonana TaxID=38151 RepID=A0A1B6BY72_9HEMI